MKNYKKILSTFLTVVLVISQATTLNALSSIEEIKGIDRYETATKISEKQIYDTAILVNSDETLVDGLSASGLAGTVGAPILLTQKQKIPYVTNQKLKNVKKVYLIGSESSISENIENQLKSDGIEIERIGGVDRYETSYNVARKISELNDINKIFLTNGLKGEADAMSVAGVAAREKAPIILTDGNNLPFDAKNIESYVIGSTSTISDKLMYETNSTRIGGKDRFDTNKKVIEKFYPTKKEFFIAKGYQLVDALTASTIAKETPIVLVHNKSNKTILEDAKKITAIGGIDPIAIQESINAANKIYEVVEHSFVEKLNVSKQTDQIVTVVGTGGYKCKVILHEKVNGIWKEKISTSGYVGKNGITNSKREGDGKTPSGVYAFKTGFGIASNPGAKINYRQVTKKDYWVDDPNSKYYNQWVTSDFKDKDWKSAEHLYSYPKAYKYGVVINYNTENIVPGKGSAIFLHVSTNGPTAGCVSVEEGHMVNILKNLKSNSRIVISQNMSDINKY